MSLATIDEQFIPDDFLLENEEARRLFHDYAQDLPIIDYHCHLPPEEVGANRQFENLSQIWLAGDHYKWRAMRTCGVDEQFITGGATDREKFLHWAETVPKLLRNPLYHWTHMELKRPFGITDRLLRPDTAEGIWDDCNAMLSTPEFSSRGLMEQMNVELVCTTDDPIDSLEWHSTVAGDESFGISMLPAWRPDLGMQVESPVEFNAWVDRLGEVSDTEIRDFQSYLEALRRRHEFFHTMGCRLSDHGLERIYAEDYRQSEIDRLFAKVRSGKSLDAHEVAQFQSAMLYEFAVMDHEKDWTQQYHLGALRGCNTRMKEHFGYDSIGDFEMARPLARFFDRLDGEDKLCRTILYNLNPHDNALMATMCGNFQRGATPGKIQFGSAWWFLDQLDGMKEQLDMLSNMGVLSCFVGMLTDSRSFLSYPRHEYFRRLLCSILGSEMVKGYIPRDFELVGSMVCDICYFNAKRYFDFDVQTDSSRLQPKGEGNDA